MKRIKIIAAVAMTASVVFGCKAGEEHESDEEHVKAKSHVVTIQQMNFSPTELLLNSGDTVTWINQDIFDHNVTAEGGDAWSSGTIARGASFTKVVDKSSDYLCTLHPVMKGKLNVRK
jgi:plastocyanin